MHDTVLAGGGEMGQLMRSIDWSRTAVGPVEGWPQSLRTALSILLETGFPMYIAWGPEFTQFYNDGYRPILGSTKHPAAMGISTRDTFAEIWDIIGPMFEGVMQGRPTTVVDFLLPLDRHGFTEECYFIFSYSPIREESGRVGGVLVTVTETTQRVIGERRLKTTQALAAETRDARTVHEACELAGRVLAGNTADLPFARIYLIAGDRNEAVLAAACGEGPGAPALRDRLSLADGQFAAAVGSARPTIIDPGRSAEGSTGSTATGSVLALPVVLQGASRPTGIVVAGTSARLALDAAYTDFLVLVAAQIGTAIAGARALEEAQARAEVLAALDRAKTAFFSNVSHEFRTPLTLMLGPTEEALSSPDGVLRGRDLETVHRNALRLLKLVNTLLDFSRIEAGRINATYEPTDLPALTADLASAFRSAVERAGLTLVVECPPLPAPVYVDREMWEKVVLNLLSNALKFTFEGSIAVEMQAVDSQAELRITDTGVGIAPENLERVFERFHRVERTRARTHEGSGIGLALVRELVSLHGGTIHATSVLGRGTCFTVRVPLGRSHLPADRIARPSATGAKADMAARRTATPYVEEALRWLPSDAQAAADGAAVRDAGSVPAPRVLVADDNADMREYLTRLLADRFRVEAVGDGAAALQAVHRERPDVVVSDVMMPGLDGFQLIAALRGDEATRTVPVVLLSARAGEEARVEGLRAGADDYLVKPFSARELIARVEAQLVRARMRTLEEAHALRLAGVFEHAPVGIAILRGPAHVFEFANRQYLELLGDRPVVGTPAAEALPELRGQGVFELLDTVYASGQPYVGRSVRTEMHRGGGNAPEEMFFDFVYQPLFDEPDRVSGIAIVAFDVTELTRARREADAANRAKDEFLAMLGHELRNPLAPILTALQLMQLRDTSGSQRERQVIERQVKHLTALVDDLLDVSRIARGHVQLRLERLDVADVVAKALEMTGPVFEERQHTLEVHAARGILVVGDAARLAQVLANLLTNAAKYTDPGGTIRVSVIGDGRSAVLTVADTGRGISPEILPRVFEVFTQEPQEIERSAGGLGVGLAIVKSLVEAHGGSVQAFSEGKGRGTEIIVHLPLASAPQSREASRTAPVEL